MLSQPPDPRRVEVVGQCSWFPKGVARGCPLWRETRCVCGPVTKAATGGGLPGAFTWPDSLPEM